MPNPCTTYRIVKVSDPRSRGACYWFDIEAIQPDGARQHVATCDDRHEARALVAAMDREHERTAAYARLEAARAFAAGLRTRKVLRHGPARLAAARELADARRAYDRAWHDEEK